MMNHSAHTQVHIENDWDLGAKECLKLSSPMVKYKLAKEYQVEDDDFSLIFRVLLSCEYMLSCTLWTFHFLLVFENILNICVQ